MKKEVAIVTGASSGFGLLTSLQLAKHGFCVIATMRNTENQSQLLYEAEQIGIKDNILIQQLDVTCSKSIQALQQNLLELNRIDVLVNNAGYASGGFAEEIPIEEYRRQFDTNVFGVIAVTQSVLPFMRTQRKGKIINISSISGQIGFPGLAPYVASKHALEGWSECLRLEVKPFGIDVVLVEPGSFHTNIWSTGKHIAEKSLRQDSPYFHSMKRIESYLESGQSSFGDPIEVARKVADIAKQKRPTLRYPIGKGIRTTLFLKHLIPWKRWERLFLSRLQ
ncbi:oxidoreductase [Bacillus sp. 165]|uniref:oxidoreductase n=1 Tax=Bacillus sp. 165 TaxID=1529117 RepID=UPI001ADC66F5|nr:oxidoreductase [Bacillus sp. 165]MBO9129225.1 oxidoreductase [Bacillus sp. 165]